MLRADSDVATRAVNHPQSGFTLLEILVVVGLVAMLSLAVLVVPVWVDDQRQLESESASLSDTLTMLNEQSLFAGRLIALELTERGWTPLSYDIGERQFTPAQGTGFQAHRLPEGLELIWQYQDLPDDKEQQLSLQDAAEQLIRDNPFSEGAGGGLLTDQQIQAEDRPQEHQEEQKRLPQVFFFPSGETTPMTFIIRSRDDLELEVRRKMSALGKVHDPDREEPDEGHTAPNNNPDDGLLEGR